MILRGFPFTTGGVNLACFANSRAISDSSSLVDSIMFASSTLPSIPIVISSNTFLSLLAYLLSLTLGVIDAGSIAFAA